MKVKTITWTKWKQLYKMIYFMNRKHENKIKINVKIVLTKITKNKHTDKKIETHSYKHVSRQLNLITNSQSFRTH